MLAFLFLKTSFFASIMEETEKQLFLKKLGEQIVKIRESKGVSASELAKKTFTETSLIARLEMGRTNPTATTLKLVAEALDVSFEELFKDFEYIKGE